MKLTTWVTLQAELFTLVLQTGKQSRSGHLALSWPAAESEVSRIFKNTCLFKIHCTTPLAQIFGNLKR